MDKIKNQLRHSRSSVRHSFKGGILFQNNGIPAYVGMISIACILVIGACSGPSHNDHGPLAQIEKHSNSNIEYTVSSDPYTYDIEKVAVTNSVNDTLFFIPNRKNHLVSFPCNNCHTQELSNMVSDDP